MLEDGEPKARNVAAKRTQQKSNFFGKTPRPTHYPGWIEEPCAFTTLPRNLSSSSKSNDALNNFDVSLGTSKSYFPVKPVRHMGKKKSRTLKNAKE